MTKNAFDIPPRRVPRGDDFDIPSKSSVTADKRAFPAAQRYRQNMAPIVLPGSSKNPPLKFMRRPK